MWVLRGAIVVLAGLGLWGALALPPAFLSGDEGVKLMQAQALLASGFRERALPYPGQPADPDRRRFPLRPPFVFDLDAQRYGIYPTLFPAASALAWRALGMRGLYLLPWLGAVVALILVGKLARQALESAHRAAAAVLLTGLCTPLLLYGTLHWEHTLAVALVLGVFVLLAADAPSRGRLLTAGFLCGAGPALRTELYCLPLAVAAFAAVRFGPGRRALLRLLVVAAAALVAAGAFWLWNWTRFGLWDPIVTVNRLANRRAGAARSLLLFIPPPTTLLRLPTWAVLLGLLAAGLVPARTPRLRGARLLLAALAVGWIAATAGVAMRSAALGGDGTLVGLLAATPLAALGVVRGPWPSGGRSRLAAACVAAALALALFTWLTDQAHAGGLQLGSRYLLPAAPLLVIGALDLARRSARLLGAVLAVLALVSLVATLVNLRAEARRRADSLELVTAVEQAGPRDVITNFKWVPQVLAPLYLKRRIFLAPSGDGRLLDSLYLLGTRRVVRVLGGVEEMRTERLIVRPVRPSQPPGRVAVYELVGAEEP
jgi:hypothetical protein